MSVQGSARWLAEQDYPFREGLAETVPMVRRTKAVLPSGKELRAEVERLRKLVKVQGKVVEVARHAANSNSQIPGAPELSHIGTSIINKLRVTLADLDKAQVTV